jgi:serine/threonine protein phosphatase 1
LFIPQLYGKERHLKLLYILYSLGFGVIWFGYLVALDFNLTSTNSFSTFNFQFFMNYFIIGDIHGCYHTFLEMLEHWDREQEILISLGDLINRGNYSSKVFFECVRLKKEFSNTIFLKGNHELSFTQHIFKKSKSNWLYQYETSNSEELNDIDIDIQEVKNWMEKMPLIYESDHLVVSHAGFSETEFPLIENNRDGVLWNRNPLKNIGKVQIHGHTPTESSVPIFTELSNSWNIDSGAAFGYGLTGIKLNEKAEILEFVHIETEDGDMQKN